jgi:hypothetical protein
MKRRGRNSFGGYRSQRTVAILRAKKQEYGDVAGSPMKTKSKETLLNWRRKNGGIDSKYLNAFNYFSPV